VSALARARVAALGAGEALGKVPDEVLQACARHGLPLLAVPAETSFAAVTEEVGRRLSGDRATETTGDGKLAEAIVTMLASGVATAPRRPRSPR